MYHTQTCISIVLEMASVCTLLNDCVSVLYAHIPFRSSMVEQWLELSPFFYNANLAGISDFLLWLLKSRQFTWNHWSHGSHYTSVSPVTEFSLVIYYVASQVIFGTRHRTKTNKTKPTQQRTLKRLATLKHMCSQWVNSIVSYMTVFLIVKPS